MGGARSWRASADLPRRPDDAVFVLRRWIPHHSVEFALPDLFHQVDPVGRRFESMAEADAWESFVGEERCDRSIRPCADDSYFHIVNEANEGLSLERRQRVARSRSAAYRLEQRGVESGPPIALVDLPELLVLLDGK